MSFLLWCLCSLLVPPEPNDAVARHLESMARIETFHVKMAADAASKPGESLVRVAEYEIWYDESSGKHRELSRAFRFHTPRGMMNSKSDFGIVSQWSVDRTETRHMQGWDPEHPLELPLRFGRNATEFAAVSCNISVRDPTAPLNSFARSALLWELQPGMPLKRIAEAATLVEVPGAGETVTRLKIVETTDPALTPLVGSLIDFDHAHGWLVRRFETQLVGMSGEKVTSVSEVMRFTDAGDGIWIPAETRMLLDGKTFSRLEVLEFDVNSAIPEEALKVEFPEGARVDDANGQLHAWGQGQPLKSFKDLDSFMEYQYARAREYQSVESAVHPAAKSKPGRRWMILANVVLVVILAVLTFLRSRLASRDVRAAESASTPLETNRDT